MGFLATKHSSCCVGLDRQEAVLEWLQYACVLVVKGVVHLPECLVLII